MRSTHRADSRQRTSTGGTFGKLEGRIGDSPLIGPGTWADDNVAISFTGTGEHIIRSGGAIAVAHGIAGGATPAAAIRAVLDEIERLGGDAGVIVVTYGGQIVMDYNSDGMKRAAVSSGIAGYGGDDFDEKGRDLGRYSTRE